MLGTSPVGLLMLIVLLIAALGIILGIIKKNKELLLSTGFMLLTVIIEYLFFGIIFDG